MGNMSKKNIDEKYGRRDLRVNPGEELGAGRRATGMGLNGGLEGAHEENGKGKLGENLDGGSWSIEFELTEGEGENLLGIFLGISIEEAREMIEDIRLRMRLKKLLGNEWNLI